MKLNLIEIEVIFSSFNRMYVFAVYERWCVYGKNQVEI